MHWCTQVVEGFNMSNNGRNTNRSEGKLDAFGSRKASDV
jgi:hypothetical protein